MDDVLFMGFDKQGSFPIYWSICDTEEEWEEDVAAYVAAYPDCHLRACLRIEDYHRLLRLAGLEVQE